MISGHSLKFQHSRPARIRQFNCSKPAGSPQYYVVLARVRRERVFPSIPPPPSPPHHFTARPFMHVFLTSLSGYSTTKTSAEPVALRIETINCTCRTTKRFTWSTPPRILHAYERNRVRHSRTHHPARTGYSPQARQVGLADAAAPQPRQQ
jgi:hypothetical protein